MDDEPRGGARGESAGHVSAPEPSAGTGSASAAAGKSRGSGRSRSQAGAGGKPKPGARGGAATGTAAGASGKSSRGKAAQSSETTSGRPAKDAGRTSSSRASTRSGSKQGRKDAAKSAPAAQGGAAAADGAEPVKKEKAATGKKESVANRGRSRGQRSAQRPEAATVEAVVAAEVGPAAAAGRTALSPASEIDIDSSADARPDRVERRRRAAEEQQAVEADVVEEAAPTFDVELVEEDTGESPDVQPAERDGEVAVPGAATAKREGDRRRPRDERRAREIEPGSAPPPTRPGTMVVNDTPGEECRIGILRDGLLEQLFMERATTATQVGNIYKGRVTNVEPAIQAAFVDYGQGQAGFLHISDLHPKYFPRGDKTERVGKKIPRRDRPLMQDALRRGDEVIVQVLKQGIGTKGPTLTSYLSIPGRLLVMMPWMDKSGVSRKVDDEDQRREMRQILDSLNLPEGFGFILRTAGFDRTKIELQRDAAYLLRLWKVMEKRMKVVGAPCALYTESDLLIRTTRDVVDSSIETIVVDSESAFTRARTFLQVVAPRSAPKVLYYDRQVPIFHAFDIERQIELTHSRIVPLRSGGALVIDQTEALVAIDVNSGKSRSARDSETNAYHTNIEAVEEIARQLRLRDLGGVVICDLIDMRSPRHRREVEERFRQHLRRDRARATTAPISDFGILEMTRQRMRPSLRKTHYIDCPHCNGHGEIKMPDAVAGDALRSIAHLLHYDRVKRVEMVCSTRVASILLSGRRRLIDELEDRSGKRVEIRISEALALDRVDLYAYDDRGADIDIAKLPSVAPPKLADLPTEVPPGADADDGEEESTGGGKRRRRRRRPAPADATTIALEGGFEDLVFELGGEEAAETEDALDGAPAGEAPKQAAAADGQRKGGRDGRDGRDRDRERGRSRAQERPAGQPATGERGDRKARPDDRAAQAPSKSPAGGAGGRQATPISSAASVQPSVDGQAGGADHEDAADGDRRRRRRRRKGGLRLGELAREVGVEPRDLVLRCRKEKIFNLQDELSRVPSEQAAMIRGWYGVAAPQLDEDEDGATPDGPEESRAVHVPEAASAAEALLSEVRAEVANSGALTPAQAEAASSRAEAAGGIEAKPPRLFELAKELGVSSKELVARCLEHTVEGVRNHMSALSSEAYAMIRSWYPPTADGSAVKRTGPRHDGHGSTAAKPQPRPAVATSTEQASPTPPASPRPGFRPLYSAGRSRKPMPAPKRGEDRRD